MVHQKSDTNSDQEVYFTLYIPAFQPTNGTKKTLNIQLYYHLWDLYREYSFLYYLA